MTIGERFEPDRLDRRLIGEDLADKILAEFPGKHGVAGAKIEMDSCAHGLLALRSIQKCCSVGFGEALRSKAHAPLATQPSVVTSRYGSPPRCISEFLALSARERCVAAAEIIKPGLARIVELVLDPAATGRKEVAGLVVRVSAMPSNRSRYDTPRHVYRCARVRRADRRPGRIVG